MTSDQGKTSASIASISGKKPYVKPTFRHEKVFETMALSCGKITTTQFSCRANRKTS